MAEEGRNTPPLVKVRLTDGSNNETLWAFDLGNRRYRLDNQPWYAYGVSCGDVVEAVPNEPGGIPDFVRVVEKSGNRTVRVITDWVVERNGPKHPVLEHLREMGCDYEGANGKFFAVTIPSTTDLWAVREYLISTNLQWEHADPTYDALFPDQSS